MPPSVRCLTPLAAPRVQVVAGGVPEDRLALKVLAEEMAEWPFLDVRYT